MPLNDSFKRRQNRLTITSLSAIPSPEDLLFAQHKATPGSPVGMSWMVNNEKRVLFVIPSANEDTSWVLRTDEATDSPMLWRYSTQDAEVIHTMLIGELPKEEVPAAVIPDELRPGHEPPHEEPQNGRAADSTYKSLTPLTPTESDFLPGSLFEDRYEIVEFIGSGGMGAVYKALQLSVDRHVALKVLHNDLVADPTSKRRFEHEAKAASTLMHPNLIVIHDFGFSKKGQPFIVMDYLEGVTLHDIIDQNGPLEFERLLQVFIQCCKALGHAHRRGVVHRDVKPCNIVLSENHDDDTELVKVLDFGIAKILDGDEKRKRDQNLTNTGIIIGSPFFMSPEQCCGLAVDNRSDLYSLGCVLYAAATACAPFIGEDHLRTMYKHIYEMAPSFSTVRPDLTINRELERITFKALEKEPARRYQTAEEFGEDLEQLRLSLRQQHAPGLPTPANSGPSSLTTELLLRAEIVTKEQVKEASKLQIGLGGEITAILVAQGKLDYAVAEAANRCRGLIMDGKISIERALIVLRFCFKAKKTFDEAAKELRWDWAQQSHS